MHQPIPGSERPGPHALPEADEALARRAGADPEAFAELYRRYLPRVYAYCHSRIGERPAAEDATGQVFLNAYRAVGRFRSDNLRAWLFAIARNVVADVHRAGHAPLPLDDAGEPADGRPGPEERSLAAEAGDELRRALRRLTPDQREVVELRLAGLTGPEIRAVLGRSRSWVDTTQHRAVRRLRELMAADPDPPPDPPPGPVGSTGLPPVRPAAPDRRRPEETDDATT